LTSINSAGLRAPVQISAQAQRTCMGRLVSRLFVMAISLFGRAATSPRPDLLFAKAAARSGGQGWPKAIAERLALDGREHSGRLAGSGRNPVLLATETMPRRSSPSCAQIARHELVFGRPARVATMMQSCASAAKLREGGPILNRGTRTIVQHRVAATSVHQLQLGIDKALGCSNSVVFIRRDAAADRPASRRLSRAATAQ